jgi:hypothetical protein
VKIKGLALAVLLLMVLVVGVQLNSRRGAPTERTNGKPIRVQVLNGSGVRRAGLRLAEALRASGFDVVEIGNAQRQDYEQTVVLDRGDRLEYAVAVAAAIGVGEPLPAPAESLLVDVTVILGRDRGPSYGEER